MTYIAAERRADSIIYLIPLIVTVSIAVAADYDSWMIPNVLVGAGLIQGLSISAAVKGPLQGLLSGIAGCMIPVAVLFVLFLIRALGAGDIKLLAVAGTFVGSDVLRVMAYSFLAGGVISLIYLLKEFFLSITSRKKISNNRFYVELRRTKLHFSETILLGVLCYVLETAIG